MLARMASVRKPSPFATLDNFFGLDAEDAIVESGIREIFTPHQPISDVELLLGRQREVQKIVQTLNTPGQHVLLYGERGVGKSSLANIVTSVLQHLIDREIFVKRCDRADTFESMLRNPLASVGGDFTLKSASQETTGNASVDLKLATGGRGRTVTENYDVSNSLSPSTVAELIHDVNGLLLVDEVDAIADSVERRKLAELIKLLSDARSGFKILIVGIAETGSELTASHPSVQRCLKETKLRRMSENELKQVVFTGAEKVGLSFTPKVVAAIARLSAGYPHFTHLIALKCAERAIAEKRTEIRDANLKDALLLAVEDAEGTLKEDYDRATRSTGTEMYRNIVIAAATVKSEEFTSAALRDEIGNLTGNPISQGSLNNFLKRLLSDDGASILRRVSKGMYRFSDPRMASYARIANALVDE
jgi:energy-coupling factor transporter ATP-binding protein EcfA2